MKTTASRWTVGVLLLLVGTLPLRAAVSVERVWPDKMVYAPNSPAVLQVDLKNAGEAPVNVTVVFELMSELDRKEEIARQAVALGPTRPTH